MLSALALVFTATATAELSQKGGLFVHFDGGISPSLLPREGAAPIAVRIEGAIRAPSAQRPPALRQIKIALNQAGRLDARGLAVCQASQIEFADASQALGACSSALVGSGGIVARTDLAGQPNALIRGEVLLFNALEGGRPAILAHIFQRKPAPITRVVVFHISHAPGTFGTVISGRLPAALYSHGYLLSIFLSLQRSYSFGGHQKSYISAGCAAPKGFSAAIFPFARVSMSFDDGRTLASTMTRSCRVRG